ncbi:hypothetical protein SLEP1_g12767 [Rubroshorea leprosula]|uniref:Uncharacterized protein n=1 Tax=Rubroshorea leprosula TaxID=152421 RepID=A0AAV5ILJ7_9ROSI|nr:hypothetical protein SLEP1_g12767 [Rubroshorea leprosula]
MGHPSIYSGEDGANSMTPRQRSKPEVARSGKSTSIYQDL